MGDSNSTPLPDAATYMSSAHNCQQLKGTVDGYLQDLSSPLCSLGGVSDLFKSIDAFGHEISLTFNNSKDNKHRTCLGALATIAVLYCTVMVFLHQLDLTDFYYVQSEMSTLPEDAKVAIDGLEFMVVDTSNLTPFEMMSVAKVN